MGKITTPPNTHNIPAAARLFAAALLAAMALPHSPARADVTGEDVRSSVQKALTFLKQRQNKDGTWGARRGEISYVEQGTTCLAVLALINGGVPVNDPAVRDGLGAVVKIKDSYTYVVSLKCQVFAAAMAAGADRDVYMASLNQSAAWLAKNQTASGMWTYTEGRSGAGDNSNTQFALLGLHEAAKAGVKVPTTVWEASRKHYMNTQVADGGWAYYFNSGVVRVVGANRTPSYGSMTAAGVASLLICGQRLNVGGKHIFVNGAYPDCGKYTQNTAVAAGLKWLADNFSVKENPKHSVMWLHYYLYALERVGMIAGLRYFGDHDWYRLGAEKLVASQAADGSWNRTQLYDTAFSLLFLAKGNRPVLFQKLQWRGTANANEWNRNVHDLDNLCAYIGDKLGKATTWQSVSLDERLSELRRGPILLITGHYFPRFSAAETAKLREFVETGGTILAEACCGSKDYTEAFRKFSRELFQDKYSLRELKADHPVFSSYHRMERDTYGLEGMDVGCRTAVFFSPHALGCLWELQDIPRHSELAFKLGLNIAAYATGREQLRDKLDVVELPSAAKGAEQPAEIPRGAVRIATLIHDGDYKADLNAMPNLAEALRRDAGVDVVAQGRYLKATDETIFDYPVLFATGHFSFALSDEETDALRKYLQRGGTLVAEACCGQKAFDKSFRELAAKLFPKDGLKPMDESHPFWKFGQPLGEVKYRRILADELKTAGQTNWRGDNRPPLEVITLQGRTAVIYSKYDWSCSLEGDNPYSCRGYGEEDGARLALRIMLFAVTF